MPQLPQPRFQSDNPYWRKISLFPFLREEIRPKLSAMDFLYATSWEIRSRDIHGASCVRLAMLKSFPAWMDANKALAKSQQEKRNHAKAAN